MSLNQRIKKVRLGESLNQIAFSESIGISQSMLNRYEKDGKEVPTTVITTIIEKYKIYSNWLLFGEGGDEPQYQEDYVRKEKYEAMTEQVNTLQNELIKYQKKEIEALEKQKANRGATSISEASTNH